MAAAQSITVDPSQLQPVAASPPQSQSVTVDPSELRPASGTVIRGAFPGATPGEENVISSELPADSKILDDPNGVILYRTPEGTPVYGRSPTVQPQGNTVQRFGKGAWDYSLGGFLQLLKGVGSMASQGFTRTGLPPDPNSDAGQMLQQIIESHADQYAKAKDALSKGNYVEAFGHSLATALPLLGPMSAHIGETFGGTDPVFDKYGNVVVQGQAPDIAQGLGQMFGLGLSEIAPRVAPKLAPKLVPNLGFESKLPPVQQQAIDYLKQEGIPLTAGQQTGSKVLRGAEASVGHMPIGAQYAEEFGTGQAEAIKGLSSRLAEQAYPTPVAPYEAGQEASMALNKEISDLNEQEQAAYDRAWQEKDNPQFAENVPVAMEQKPMLDATGKPTGTMQNVPMMENVQMPVDVRWMKRIAKQELPKLEYLPAAEQAQSAAFSIYRKILSGPDHISAEQAEEALKGLKGEARKAPSPDLRNYSQGAAASLIPRLQAGVDQAVAKTGQEAVDALRNGRNLHYQKTQVADVADALRNEPVQAFGQMTMAKDAGVDFLKKIATKAPDIMPRLGRAWLDNVFDLASREGDWRKAQTILNKWNDLGNKTKALMFPEASLRQALERFFLGQKMTGIQLNPSGTALVTATQKAMANPLGWAQGWIGGRALYTPRGIRLLLKATENPPTTPAAAAALKSEATKILGPPEEPPEGPPAGGGPAGGGPPAPAGGYAQWRDANFTRGASGMWEDKAGNRYTDEALHQMHEAPPAPAGRNLADTLQGQADSAIQRMRDRGTFSGTQSNALFPAEDLADMAIWGAAKMAKGVTQLGAWSKEMLADAGASASRLKPQLPKLYVMAQKTLERHIANTAGNLPSTQKMLSMYRQGIEGQDWYRNTKAELQSVFGPDTDKFVDFLAATSPNTTVAANTSLALKAYMQWKTGKPFTGYLPETIKSRNRAAAGEEFGGLKVQSFRKNLHGDAVPVTVDRWIARALGFGDQPTVPQYKFMDYLVSQVAAKKGLEPRQLQAAIWKTIKDTEGLAGQGGESYEVLVRRKLLSDPDLAAAIQQAAPQR